MLWDRKYRLDRVFTQEAQLQPWGVWPRSRAFTGFLGSFGGFGGVLRRFATVPRLLGVSLPQVRETPGETLAAIERAQRTAQKIEQGIIKAFQPIFEPISERNGYDMARFGGKVMDFP